MSPRTLRTALFCLVIAAPSARSQAPAAPANPAQAPARMSYPQDTPESAFKSFFLAMALGDEAALKALTIPADGFEWLLKGDHITPAQAGEFRAKVVDPMMLTRLKAGDEVKMPAGPPLTIKPEQVTDDRAVLTIPGGPVPTDLHRVMGAWKVDPRAIIAGRKAADAARRKIEEAKKKAQP